MTAPGVEKLRDAARRLLEEGRVQVVLGYSASGHPLFARRAEDADRLHFGANCRANLTAYLKRKEVAALGKAAIVVKGCDERALVVLEQESQLERGTVHVLGVACDGTGEDKCASCDRRLPRLADEVFGTATAATAAQPAPGPGLPAEAAARFTFWKEEFERCTRCYACRQACPLCYCTRCVAGKNRPTAIPTSASLRGNFAWHITRAFHLAGRCTGCGECARACPAGIRLDLLNAALAEKAFSEFGFRPGLDPAAEPLLGCWSPSDKEDFIR